MEILRIIRKRENLTQDELACKLGITRSYLSLLENGDKSPSLDLFIKMCEVLNYHPCLFICYRLKNIFPACVSCKNKDILKNHESNEYERFLDIIAENRKLFLDMTEKYNDDNTI